MTVTAAQPGLILAGQFREGNRPGSKKFANATARRGVAARGDAAHGLQYAARLQQARRQHGQAGYEGALVGELLARLERMRSLRASERKCLSSSRRHAIRRPFPAILGGKSPSRCPWI
jgi:hypothetical protein